MRGVLVDDDDGVSRLRHDVGLVQLRARRAERAVEQRLGRGIGAGARIRARGREGLERRLHRLGEAVRDAAARGGIRCGTRARSKGTTLGSSSSSVAAPPRADARWPAACSADASALTISERTRPASRKRTSAFAGCTFTSTSAGGSVTNSASSGWRPRGMRSP